MVAGLVAKTVSSCDHHIGHHVQSHLEVEARVLEAAASSKASSTSYNCPVCGMSSMYSSFANTNYVSLENGQRFYTCGMAAHSFADYSFSTTETSYLAANMAEFIVSEKDSDNYSDCDNSCDECADGIYDPVSGDQVTTANFHFACLLKGQKIYFASLESKNTYLRKVNQEVRYLVNNSICGGSACSDATRITKLSAAAASMVPYIDEGSGSTSASSAAMNMSTPSTDSEFCSGEGSVMFNGFQSTVNGSCIKLLFQPWVLNSAVKYAFGFVGCFVVTLFSEFLVKAREDARQKLLAARKQRSLDKIHKIQCKLLLAVLYMVQMTIAYFAMLVVMTYETGLFISLLLGFGAGFMLFKKFDLDVTNERGVWRFMDPSTIAIRISGMTCMANCGTTVEKALAGVPGVTNAFVAFDEKTAYVSGSASRSELVEVIEAVGYSVENAG